PVGRRVSRIEFDRLGKQNQCLIDRLSRPTMHLSHRLEEVVMGIEALRRLVCGPLDLGTLAAWGDCADDTGGGLVRQRKDVVEPAFKALGPEIRARDGVDELASDPYPVCRFA